MNTFEDRKKGYEAKYQKDQEAKFKITAKRNRILGLFIGAQIPISKFARFEASFSTNYTEHALVEEYQELGFIEENEFIEDSFITMMPAVQYIWDNTIWEYIFPNKGSRFNINMKASPKIGKKGITFQSIILDYRKYYPIKNGISLGVDEFGKSAPGKDIFKSFNLTSEYIVTKIKEMLHK